jgi:hypothetical protein
LLVMQRLRGAVLVFMWHGAFDLGNQLSCGK